MKIVGIEGMNDEQIHMHIQQGARFVVFEYCISILILTFRRPTDVYFIKKTDNAVLKGMPFTVLSLLAGWWGFPWGPIYTITSLVTNFRGGRDVTDQIIAAGERAPSVA